MSTAAGRFPVPDRDPGPSLCPYCGAAQPVGAERCETCGGLFEPLSKQASQNEMGPWFIRDDSAPHRPGCSLQTLKRLIAKGRIKPESVIRGPSTRQFWSLARNVQGVAHLLGECHNCHRPARATDYMCRSCGAVFTAPTDRQHLGLGPIHLIPGQAPPEMSSATRAVETGSSDEAEAEAPPQRRQPQSPGEQGERVQTAERSVWPQETGGPSSEASRRLRRRLARTKRAAAASAALNVVLVAALAGLFAWRGFGIVGAGGADEQAGSAAQIGGDALANKSDEASETANAAGADDAAKVGEAEKWRDRRDEALEQAEQGDRDAIAAALRRLRRIRDQAPAAVRPDGLDQDIAGLERRLDELALQEFLQEDQRNGG